MFSGILKKKSFRIIIIFYTMVVLFLSCKGQENKAAINDEQKGEIVKIIFSKIDSTTYISKGFGLVDNEYLLLKPEIKALIPEIDSLYDTLKNDISKFIEKNKVNLPYNSGFNEALVKYFDDNNYNNLDFYSSKIVFTGLYFYQDDKEFLIIIEKFMDEFMVKINRHSPKLYFAIEKYINSGYVDDLKDKTTFWHSYSYEKDGITIKKNIIVYFFPNGRKGNRILNINRVDY